MDETAARAEYDARLNRAVDFIERNLQRAPSLAEIARAAGFSSYHFHRLFSARFGETVGQFTSRTRLERAAARLLDRSHESITEVALDLGFSSSATFARAFRARFGTTASQWRRQGSRRRVASRPGRDPAPALPLPEVEVERWPALDVAYVRHVGAYAGDDALYDELFARLAAWAQPRGLVSPETRWLSLYHDPPGITGDERLRLSVGLVLPEGRIEPAGEVARLTIDPGDWAVVPFDLLPAEYERAWDAVYADWLPATGYQPAHRPSLEVYPPIEAARPGARRVEICLPVEPLFARSA